MCAVFFHKMICGHVYGDIQFNAAIRYAKQLGIDPDEVEVSGASCAFRKAIRKELAGKNLMCWCPEDQPCHADTLLEIANYDYQESNGE